jgi:hypothetical protein
MTERTRQYILDRIKIEDRGHSTPCWIWQRWCNPKGYALAAVPGFRPAERVHRAAYTVWVGPIPDGLQIDHLCRVTSCVNPAHLEPVTILENVRRALGYGPDWQPAPRPKRTHGPSASRRKDFCKRGHEMAIHRRPQGDCRLCRNIHKRDSYYRKKRALAELS